MNIFKQIFEQNQLFKVKPYLIVFILNSENDKNLKRRFDF